VRVTGRSLRLLVVLLALAGSAPVASATNFLIPTADGANGFGDFHEGQDERDVLRVALGAPTSIDAGTNGCVLRYADVGVTVMMVNYGLGDPLCDSYFFRARLTDRRWHTASGVHVGSSAALARRGAHGRHCRDGCGGPGVSGYVLARHRSECAPGLWPRVIAEIRNGRVHAFVVLTTGCE
jgi:hypothetical protein